jgi:glycerophosphoryl diester phosphodiesterase
VRLLAIALVSSLIVVPATSAPAGPDPTDCLQAPEPARWMNAGTPDVGLDPMMITVHRGAAELAPENTIPAFEYAIAYGLPMIEVDVQQTRDGRYVVFHDYQVDAKTNGSGFMHVMSYQEAKALNVADNDKWRGSEYDPSFMPDLEDVLALASDHEVGINFDLKESVYNAAGVALMASEYDGVIERSIFQPYVPGRAEQILAVAPDATIMINPQFDTPPAALYLAGAEYDWFGSDLDWFPPEAIAAIHDACDFVQPNVYNNNPEKEASDLALARSIGADGAMVNHPAVAADVLDRPVATSIRIEDQTACLLGHRDLGLPGKTLIVDELELTTGRGGCASIPSEWSSISFAGDGSADPSMLSP